MCLAIRTKFSSKKYYNSDTTDEEVFANEVRVSNRDIKVWKRFTLAPRHRWHGPIELTTPYRNTKVAITGDVMTAKKFGVYADSNGATMVVYVDQGIHAHGRLYDGLQDLCDDEVLLECTIPAGTPHAFGEYDEVVALQIIVPPVDRQSVKGLGEEAEASLATATIYQPIVQVK